MLPLLWLSDSRLCSGMRSPLQTRLSQHKRHLDAFDFFRLTQLKRFMKSPSLSCCASTKQTSVLESGNTSALAWPGHRTGPNQQPELVTGCRISVGFFFGRLWDIFWGGREGGSSSACAVILGNGTACWPCSGIRQYMRKTMLAHQYWRVASRVQRLMVAAGTVRDPLGLGST